MSNRDERMAAELEELADGMQADCAAFRTLAEESKTAVEAIRMASEKYKDSDMPPLPEADDLARAYEDVGAASQRLHIAFVRMLDRLQLNAQILRAGNQPSPE